MALPARGHVGRGAWWAAVAVMCAILLAPLALVDVPPLLDYPNHLARAYLLATRSEHSPLSAIYSAKWGVIPNIAVDLVLPPLMHVLPVHIAGRVVVGVVLLLPVVGTIAYSRALFRTRSWWPLSCGLVAYNAMLLSGFLNFAAGVGLALLLAAAWIQWRETRPIAMTVLASVGAIALFFCHLMGLVFYLILIGSVELAWASAFARAEGIARWPMVARRAGTLAPVLAGPIALYAMSDFASARSEVHWLSPGAKLAQLLVPLVNYDLALDVGTACVVAVLVLLCLTMRRVIVPTSSVVTLASLSILYLVSPFEFKGTAALDTRFAIMLAFVVCGGALPVRVGSASPIAGSVLVLLFVVRMAVLGSAWADHRQDLAELRRVIALVPPGSLVYLTSVAPPDAPDYWWRAPRSRRLSDGTRTEYHLAALLVIERHAFWPYLFAQPAQQPIEVAPEYHARAMQTLALPDGAFVAGCRALPMQPDTATLASALCGYDYVLLLEAGAIADLARCGSGVLELRARSDIAALFSVRTPRLECTAKR